MKIKKEDIKRLAETSEEARKILSKLYPDEVRMPKPFIECIKGGVIKSVTMDTNDICYRAASNLIDIWITIPDTSLNNFSDIMHYYNKGLIE